MFHQIIKIDTALALSKYVRTKLTHEFAERFDHAADVGDAGGAADEDFLCLQELLAGLLDPQVPWGDVLHLVVGAEEYDRLRLGYRGRGP